MVVSAKPSLITLSSNLLYCICLQCVYHARFFSDLTPKINRRHSIINLFLHCPNSQKPKEIVSFDKCISINVLCLGIKTQKQTQELPIVADFWFVYIIFIVWVALCWMLRHLYMSDCGLTPLPGLLLSPRAYVFSMQETVNCNKSWRGRPVETNGSAFDK